MNREEAYKMFCEGWGVDEVEDRDAAFERSWAKHGGGITLVSELASGRSLWVELMPHVDDCPPDVTDPHVTLLFFGKRRPASLLEMLRLYCEDLGRSQLPEGRRSRALRRQRRRG